MRQSNEEFSSKAEILDWGPSGTVVKLFETGCIVNFGLRLRVAHDIIIRGLIGVCMDCKGIQVL